MFLWKLSYERMYLKGFCEADIWENVFCEQTCRRMFGWDRQRTMLWHWFTCHFCWSSLCFADVINVEETVAWIHLTFFLEYHLLWLCREKCTKELMIPWELPATLADTGWMGEPHGFFWIELTLLVYKWWFRVDRATTADSCDLNCWYPDDEVGIAPKKYF